MIMRSFILCLAVLWGSIPSWAGDEEHGEEAPFVLRPIISHLSWTELMECSVVSKAWRDAARQRQRELYPHWILIFPRGPSVHTFLEVLNHQVEALFSEYRWPQTLDILRYYGGRPTTLPLPFFMRNDFLEGEPPSVHTSLLKTRPLWTWLSGLGDYPPEQNIIADALKTGRPPQIIALGEEADSFFDHSMPLGECIDMLQMLLNENEDRIREVGKSLRDNPMVDGEWGFTRFAWITLWLY